MRGPTPDHDYRHFSEHFGFMTAGDFHRGAPLPLPRRPGTLVLARERFARLAEVVSRPLGLENLALAMSEEDAREHGRFLAEIVSAVPDGFVILDLHNLYCQLHNFGVGWEDLLEGYPLERVREMHVSGGSWGEAPSAPGRAIRRDTHDDAVPERVFELLEEILPRCPAVEAVVFERLGHTLPDRGSRERFLEVLKREGHAEEIRRLLLQGELSVEQRAWVESMRPEMLETAAMLVKRWGRGG